MSYNKQKTPKRNEKHLLRAVMAISVSDNNKRQLTMSAITLGSALMRQFSRKVASCSVSTGFVEPYIAPCPTPTFITGTVTSVSSSSGTYDKKYAPTS